MQLVDIHRIVKMASLEKVEPEWVAGITWLLHEALIRHDIACTVEFDRLEYVEKVRDPQMGDMDIVARRIVVGIRMGECMFNARGRDPWKDALQDEEGELSYSQWKCRPTATLGQEAMEFLRQTWQPQIDQAVSCVSLSLNTPQAFDEARIVRL